MTLFNSRMNPAQRELLMCLSKILVQVLPILFQHLEIAIWQTGNRWRHRMLKLDVFIKMGRHQRNHPGKRFWTNDILILILPFERKFLKFFEFFEIFEIFIFFFWKFRESFEFSNFWKKKRKFFRTKIAHQNAEEVETDRQNFIFNQLRKRNFSWTDDVINYDSSIMTHRLWLSSWKTKSSNIASNAERSNSIRRNQPSPKLCWWRHYDVIFTSTLWCHQKWVICSKM